MVLSLSEKEQLSTKRNEYVKLKESAKKAKQEPRDRYQSRYSPRLLLLFATDSLELHVQLAETFINEHTITNEHRIRAFKSFKSV